MMRRFLIATILLASLFRPNAFGRPPSDTVILGDVEGQWPLFRSFFLGNIAFQWSGKDTQLPILRPGFRFVFAGDAIDRGPSRRKILQFLVRLHDRYPDRVVLLMGNRDINKLRLPYELDGVSDPAAELKRILSKTMGAAQAFEFAREELSREQRRPATDQEVVDSMLEDLRLDQGLMAHYLARSQLVFLDSENGMIAVHGAITEESFGRVPDDPELYTDVRFWARALNRWGHNQIMMALRGSYLPAKLISYQEPLPETRANQGSVVYGRFSDEKGTPRMIPRRLQDILLQQGFHTIVSGHTPAGEFPVLMANDQFRIVLLDNSYSQHQTATHVMLSSGIWLQVRGISPAVSGQDQVIHYLHTLGEETPLGSITGKGERVIGRFDSARGNGWVTSRVLPGFKVETALRSREALADCGQFLVE